MINQIRYEDGRDYICDDCQKTIRFKSYDLARAAGWAISYDRKICYCPNCAPLRRNVGWTGARRKAAQLNIDGLNGVQG